MWREGSVSGEWVYITRYYYDLHCRVFGVPRQLLSRALRLLEHPLELCSHSVAVGLERLVLCLLVVHNLHHQLQLRLDLALQRCLHARALCSQMLVDHVYVQEIAVGRPRGGLCTRRCGRRTSAGCAALQPLHDLRDQTLFDLRRVWGALLPKHESLLHAGYRSLDLFADSNW